MLADPPLFAVADGMGGHAAGEVAASLVISALRELAGRPGLSAADVNAVLARANDDIARMAALDAARAGMGTTVAGLVLLGGSEVAHWMVFNVGDSRVYRFGRGLLEQVSRDHSEVEEMVLAGHISRAEARVHRQRNVVTRSLGTVPAPAVDSWLLPAVGGERYLVCSDGLTGELPDDDIGHVLANEWDPVQAARQLIARAVAAGGRDNVTAVVVDVAEVGGDPVDGDTMPRHLQRRPVAGEQS